MEEGREKLSITENAIKKQKKILIIAVFCIITLFAGTSYALLTNFDTSDTFIEFSENDKSIKVNKLKSIKLNKISKEEDLEKIKPIVLTFTNNGNVDIDKYIVKLINDKDIKVKYMVSTDLGVTYGDAKTLDENIYTGSNLEVKKSKTIYLKVWVDAIDKIPEDSLDVNIQIVL